MKRTDILYIDMVEKEEQQEPLQHSAKPLEWMWHITIARMVLPDLPEETIPYVRAYLRTADTRA